MARNRSVRITKKRSKIFIKNKTYRNKRGRVGGVFSLFGETGAFLKENLRYIGVVKSNDIFKSFTGCDNDANCTKIISTIINNKTIKSQHQIVEPQHQIVEPQHKIVEHTLTISPDAGIILFCSTDAFNTIQKLYDSINAKDKAKLYGILIKISQEQQIIQEKFQNQIDELMKQIKASQEKIKNINNELQRILGSVELANHDIHRSEELCEKSIADLMEKNVLLATEIQAKKNRIDELETEKSNAAAAASKSSSSFKDMVSSLIGPKPSENERADTQRDIIHRINNNTIDKLKKDISVLQTEIQENKNKIENRKKISEKEKKGYENDISKLQAKFDNKNIELQQANDKLKENQKYFDTKLLELTEQRDAKFGNINSGNSGNPVSSGGRRTVWRRCHSRRRHHRRRNNKIRKSRNGRKIRRN